MISDARTIISATLAEASQLLNLSPRALAARIAAGDIPAAKSGKKRFILVTDLVRACQNLRRIPRGQEATFAATLEASLKAGIIALREIKTAQKAKNRIRKQLNFHTSAC